MKNILLVLILFPISLNLIAQSENEMENEILKYNKPGYFFLSKGIYDSAEYYLLKSLQLQEAFLGKDNWETAATNINLGVLYRNTYDFQKALKHLNTAEQYFLKYMPNSIYLGYIYNNKGNVYYNFADYSEAEIYYRYCIDYLKSYNLTPTPAYSQAVINLFNILVTQNRYKEALEILESQTAISSDSITAFNRQMFLTEAYSRLNDFDQALIEAKKAKEIYDKELKSYLPGLMIFNYRMASINVKLGDFNTASKYLMENIKISSIAESISFEKLYQTYLLIGNIYYLKGEYNNCISWLKSAITKIESNEIKKESGELVVERKIYNKDLIDFYRLIANAGYKLYNQTKNIDDLKLALENYEYCIEYIKVIRIHMRNEKSIHLESDSRLDISHEAVNVSAKLYKITNDIKYLEQAFMYAENIKSFSLYTEIKGGEAMQFSDLPKKIKVRESFLMSKLEAYNELINNEKSKLNPNVNLIDYYNSYLFNYKNDYNSLIDSIENFYPKYYNFKYKTGFISPTKIKVKIGRNEALVEYVLSDTVLTTFIIDRDQIKILTQDINPEFSEECLAYFSLLQNQDFSKNVHQTYRDFVRMGRKFYEILVAPVLKETESREITFVPDGALMYLPFESFITKDVDEEYISYNELPYLIYDISVGYSYSSTLLYNDRIKSKSPLNKVLAFAPTYTNLLDPEQSLEWNRQANPDMLMPLPGARQEVKFISKTVPSDVYIDTAATEKNFKLHASDYSVLHLAMHTIMNDEDPMFSKLAFTRNLNDTTQDHDLFTYEIYNMKLNAEMVVLSSCSSGYGKMQKGEGMMSMARGFIYAGCPSIVMTLWQVSDMSSAELMSGFYKNLKRGNSKKKSLRQAKIAYIKSSDNLKANPYFWSAFMLVGDNSPLFGHSVWFYYGLLISAFSLFIIFLTYKKQIIKLFRKK